MTGKSRYLYPAALGETEEAVTLQPRGRERPQRRSRWASTGSAEQRACRWSGPGSPPSATSPWASSSNHSLSELQFSHPQNEHLQVTLKDRCKDSQEEAYIKWPGKGPWSQLSCPATWPLSYMNTGQWEPRPGVCGGWPVSGSGALC